MTTLLQDEVRKEPVLMWKMDLGGEKEQSSHGGILLINLLSGSPQAESR